MPKPKNPSSPKPAKKAAVKKTAVKKTAAKKVAVKVKKSAGAAVDKIEKYVTEQSYLILKSLDDGKAEDILDFDLRGVSSLADYIIIASGRSTRQVSSLAENISKSLKAAGHKILNREGQSTNDWVIVDTGDIIVHLLRPEVRSYYRLEDMWEKRK
jgi:ribosome-associated protein